MKNYKARGIVLHTVKYGESSLVAYMLTDTVGRQTYMVQGAGGRSRTGRGNLFQPVFPLEFVGLHSPKMQMHRMKEVRTAYALGSLPFDIRKSTICMFMAEVLYRVVREVEAHSPVFDFVYSSVAALEQMEEGISNFHIWFLVRLSYYLGFYPGNTLSDGRYFDLQEGLFVPRPPSHDMSMDEGAAELLGRMMDCQVTALDQVKLSRERRSGFMNGMMNYFSYHLDSVPQIKSVQILGEVF